MDCAKKTIQWEGPLGLYKGVTSPLAGQMFFRAALFSSLGSAKRWLATNSDGTKKALSISDCYVAGAMAGCAGAFFEGPIDFYKSQARRVSVVWLRNACSAPEGWRVGHLR